MSKKNEKAAKTKVSAEKMDDLILEFKRQKRNFKTYRSSTGTELVLDCGTTYETAKVLDFSPRVMNEIKNAQIRIIEHTFCSPELVELLKEKPLVTYYYAKEKTHQTELVQIDIKSAYFSCAQKMGFIPTDLKCRFEHLIGDWIKAGEKPEKAEKMAKQTKVVTIGSLAKKIVVSDFQYKPETTEEREEYNIQTKEMEKYNVTLCEKYNVESEIVRVKGREAANIYFHVAAKVTELCRQILFQVKGACFYWVDAIFIENEPEALNQAREILRKNGYQFKEEPPQKAYWDENKNSWNVYTNEIDENGYIIVKPYIFARDTVETKFLDHFQTCLAKLLTTPENWETGDLIRRTLNQAKDEKAFNYACKILISNGINPNRYFKKVYQLVNDEGYRDFISMSVLTMSKPDLQTYFEQSDYWQNKLFWEQLADQANTWRIEKTILAHQTIDFEPFKAERPKTRIHLKNKKSLILFSIEQKNKKYKIVPRGTLSPVTKIKPLNLRKQKQRILF